MSINSALRQVSDAVSHAAGRVVSRALGPRVTSHAARIATAVLVPLSVTGCGTFAALSVPNVAVGSAAAAVRAQVGAPHDERTLADGSRAWDYLQGPAGFRTYRVVFDASNRVRAVEQLLTEQRFLGIRAGASTREDVGAMLGRPGSVSRYALSSSEVWTYRYRDHTFEMLNDVHFSSTTGRVLYYALYRDPAYNSAMDR